jgi:hypothetical protein
MTTTDITGYRQLDPRRVALINRIKAIGHELGDVIAELRQLPPTGPGAEPADHPQLTIDQRAVSIAATELQGGMMWLVRSVAQPQSFA